MLLLTACEEDKPNLPPLVRYQNLADIIQEGVRNDDMSIVIKRFSSGLLNRQIKKEISLPPRDQQEIRKLAETTFKTVMDNLAQTYGIENGGYFKLDSIYFKGKIGHLLFSGIGALGTVNFIDFSIEAYDQGLYIRDYLIYYNGITLSNEVLKTVRGILATQSNVKGKMVNPYLDAVDQLEVMMNMYELGRCEAAWKKYEKLHPRYQKNLIFIPWKMRIGSCIAPEKYAEVASDFIQQKEIEPSAQVYHTMMKAFYLKDIQAFDKAITELKKITGDVPEYEYLKALLFLEKGEADAALTYIERSFVNLAVAFPVHDAKLRILMANKREQEAYECLLTISELFELEWDYFSELFDEYPALQEMERSEEKLQRS